MEEKSFSYQLQILGQTIFLETRPGLPGWRDLETARHMLIETMEVKPKDRVVELACTYGVCGIVAALLATRGQVTLVDDDALAIEVTEANIRRNFIQNASAQLTADYDDLLDETFDVALLHAPAYRGNDPVRHLIETAHRVLCPGGRLFLAGGMHEGLPTFRQWTENLFGPVDVLARQGGHRVLLAVKSGAAVEEGAVPTGTEFMATIEGEIFVFHSRPPLLVHDQVDPAGRILLEVAEIRTDDEILDLGCGYGLLGIVAARLAPEGHVVMVDRSPLAVELARENAELNGIDNVEVLSGKGVEPIGDRHFDLILFNPRDQAVPSSGGAHLIGEAATVLKPAGRLYVVCDLSLPYEKILEETLAEVKEVTRRDGFKVLLGRQRQHSAAPR